MNLNQTNQPKLNQPDLNQTSVGKTVLLTIVISIGVIFVMWLLFILFKLSTMINGIQQERICSSAIILPNENIAPDSTVAAVYQSNIMWTNGQTIRIKFLSKPVWNFPVTYNVINYWFSQRDQNGNRIIFDPLQGTYEMLSANVWYSIPNLIKKIVQERFAKFLNLKFVFYESTDNSPDATNAEIRINFDTTKGCNSYIGTQNRSISKSNHTMNFAWFDVATVLHEFGHALGLFHEHQSPFENKIKWNLPELYKWGVNTQGWDKTQVDQQVVNMLNPKIVTGSSFDSQSVMLYFFPKNLTLDKRGTSQNCRLSPNDVKYLAEKYSGGPQTPQAFYKNAYNINI